MSAPNKAKILVSACLMGQPVRYDGKAKPLNSDVLALWRDQGRLLVICPELAGGFSAPRRPAEILGEGGGAAVLDGRAKVIDVAGQDVTQGYLVGARQTLRQALAANVVYALLKDGSPSCGSRTIYDGGHRGAVIAGSAVTAALLSANGIGVFSENSLAALVRAVARRDAAAGSPDAETPSRSAQFGITTVPGERFTVEGKKR
jgi:uncharacterized protein YbbK (DUF523 family)